MVVSEKINGAMVSDSEQESYFFERMTETLSQTPEGRKALNDIETFGYKIYLDDLDNETGSRSFPAKKTIILDSKRPVTQLPEILIKEAEIVARREKNPALAQLLSRLDYDLVPMGAAIDEYRDRFERILNLASQMPGGQKILDQMETNTCEFSLSSMDGQETKGDFFGSYNVIFLNRNYDDKTIAEAFLKQSENAIAYANRDSKSVLKEAFMAQNSVEKENFALLVEKASQAPAGKEVLEKFAKLNYSIAYENLSERRASGVCDRGKKMILLDPSFPLEKQVLTLVHEAEHAVQFSLCEDVPINRLNAADYLKFNRAVEADACAHSAATAYQLRSIWPEVYAYNMGTPMVAAYFREMDASQDENRAMASSFQAWYDYEHYQVSYEKDHTEAIQGKTRFQESMSNEDVLSVCLFNGQSYVDPEFLSSEKACAISRAGQENILETVTKKALAKGHEIDMSVTRLPTREGIALKKQVCSYAQTSIQPEKSDLYKAVVDEALKLPFGADVLEKYKKQSFYFADLESGKVCDYIPEADVMVLDARKSPAEIAAALAVAVPEITENKEKGVYDHITQFAPSFTCSPAEELVKYNSIVKEISQNDESLRAFDEALKLGYMVRFDNIVPPKTSLNMDYKKQIVLNASSDSHTLASSLVKESVFVIQQDENKKKEKAEDDRLMAELAKDLAAMQKTSTPQTVQNHGTGLQAMLTKKEAELQRAVPPVKNDKPFSNPKNDVQEKKDMLKTRIDMMRRTR